MPHRLQPIGAAIPDRKPIVREHPDDVEYTLTLIHSFIQQGATDPTVVRLARNAVAEERVSRVTSDNIEREIVAARAIWRWVRDHIAFVHDPHTGLTQTELVCDCENILRNGSGDCDEHTILAGAMLRAVGFGTIGSPVGPVDQVQIVVGGPYNAIYKTCIPTHVFLALITSDLRHVVVIDPTLTDEPFGTLAGQKEGWSWMVWQPKGGSPAAARIIERAIGA